ncbi:MAG: hypothetical protein RL670_365 [Actinomycetota bacterium]
MTYQPKLIATCWTSAGDVAPLAPSEVSPFNPLERVRAIAETGWVGFGLGQDDLRNIEQTVGFDAIYDLATELGLNHIEVELATNWWLPESSGWRDTWDLLLRASTALKANFIKIGSAFGDPADDLEPFVEPLRRLAQEAQDAGTRVALEPLPFAIISSMPMGAELISKAGHSAAGLCVDYWHIFRAGTTLQEMQEKVPVEQIFSVELSDAYNKITGTLFEDTRDNRTLLGQGEQDVTGFIRTLLDMGYAGAWGVEILSSEHRKRELHTALEVAFETAVSCFDKVTNG